jgi:murein DD-endopeptidase MepM/ murein hydrolase activator NlpD
MAKIKYKYNHHTLEYQKVRVTFKDNFFKLLSYLAAGIVFSTVIILLAYNFLDSPKEKMLKREIKQYELRYEIMNDKLNVISKVLEDIQNRDDNIYRVIFEADPIPNTVRKAGFGGVDKYAKLEGYKNSDIIIETTKKVDKITRQLYIQSKSFDDVYALAKNKTQMLACIPAIQPISNKELTRIASGFGMRIHPIYKTMRMHTGIDFSAPVNTPVYATGDGIIGPSDSQLTGYGIVCVIDHGYGYKTLYAHLRKTIVRPGQKVKRGQIIGFVGNTGLSIGPHLHYEVRKENRPLNPIHYFYNDLTPEEFQKVIEISSRVNQALS